MHNVQHHNDDEWATRGAVALKVATLFTVIAVVAVGISGVHRVDESKPIASAPSGSAASAPDAKPYYFPSEYELHAPEPGEPVPTF